MFGGDVGHLSNILSLKGIPMIQSSLARRIEYRQPYETAETRIDHTEEGGRLVTAALANIPLTSGQVAQCDLSDFNDLMSRGFSDQLWGHSNGSRHFYVRTTRADAPRATFNVGRLIMGGRWGTRLRYLDGNPLNLRRINLKVGEGYSKGLEAAAMAEIVF